jgi:hypothetical protein
MLVLQPIGQRMDEKNEPPPDFPPAAVKPALPTPADPEDPLEAEVDTALVTDELPPEPAGFEPPAPGEGP